MSTDISTPTQKQHIKLAIIGSRSFKNKKYKDESLKSLQDEYIFDIVVSGGANGADAMGEQWANKQKIPTNIFYPDFKNRKHAYHFRNRQIVEQSDVVVAFWDGSSTGTKYTMSYAKKIGKKVVVFKY